ncbi:hypothetical protein ONZ45_g13062 [Pleurotus djamor]|nr:hypothetical protein ONZ45_g13062 [Pleurotus djamor]
MGVPKSPSPPKEQVGRLTPVLDLEEAGIPAIVYAKDALSFIYNVPTYLSDQQLLVHERHIQAAVQVLCEKYAFTVLDLSTDEIYCDDANLNPEKPSAFQGHPSTLLGRKLGTHGLDHDAYTQLSDRIIIHAGRTYHFDMNDPSRFPTFPAFYDSLIDTYLEPPLPFLHTKFKFQIDSFIGYLNCYTVSSNGRTKFTSRKHPERLGLTLKCLATLDGLKHENRPYLTRRLKGAPAFGYIANALERSLIKEACHKAYGLPYTRPTLPYAVPQRIMGLEQPTASEIARQLRSKHKLQRPLYKNMLRRWPNFLHGH